MISARRSRPYDRGMSNDSFDDVTLPLSGERWFPSAGDDVPAQFGHYERLELVGRGGMGSVYRAYDTRLQRTVALKFIHASSPEMKARLVHEARTQARIDDTLRTAIMHFENAIRVSPR